MMEQEQVGNNDELEGSGKSSSYLCRQSSTRWSPTSEQIRILKELYYNNGVRSPTADQIQRISAKLRQYGKIEGKNVFYWFQNHKARERQKKRFTTHIPRPTTNCKYYQDHHFISPPIYYNKFSNNNIGGHFPSSSSSSPGLLTMAGYGSVAMEKSFRECRISPSSGGGWMGHDERVGVDPFVQYPSANNNNDQQTLEMEDYEEEEEERETLALFPMHGEIIKEEASTEDYNYMNDIGTSLELTLNSYAAATFPTS